MSKLTYIRLRARIKVSPDHQIRLAEIAQILTIHEGMQTKLENMIIHTPHPSEGQFVILDLLQVIRKIREIEPEIEIESLGPTQTIVEVVSRKKKPPFVAVLFVWVLLFVGSGLTIMNFHTDVSMPEVHRKIFSLLTGKDNNNPLILQIPYSIGIGVGMILFFNHLFKKRLNEEPSPLEVEMFLYQQNLDQYLILHENKENRRDYTHD
ncbi:stage V sporulation protein AA [Microaerobacter geothermalis]|uniref:stage V sporulation protein AA n=1 Tax=Microaerobacter geothermalis TaxID=674972 RepID=UPI001F3EC547|nr:stage V sporulation protein AA [Microaerobacter geothermalis]MCF6093475.1 stage V sporulation protein AA [Microaerobacter geothermalis]